MNKSKIKICGIKSIRTLDCCIENKVNFFGLIFYKKSPRNILVKKAKKLIDYSKNKNILSVGVFVNEPINEIKKLLRYLNLDFAQLHGEEDNNYIKSIKKENIKIIKSISINSSVNLSNTSKYPDADMFLFDYKPNKGELPGGNAKSFNWEIISNIVLDKPWFLSGGIDIDNIKKIKKYAIPYGIDISSGVEVTKGHKNNNKITSLIKSYEYE